MPDRCVNHKDAGQIILDGKEITPTSPQDAISMGISTVFQEINLCPNLTVAENIFAGRQPMKHKQINWKEINRRAEKLMQRFHMDIDVTRPLYVYSTAVQQIEYTVEINDTYPGIAAKFNTTLDSIQRLNDIEDMSSFPTFGQTLIIAVNLVTPTPSPVPASAEVPANVRVGDIITFGRYEQDNNLDNGPEPIEWQVLDVQDGRALVISKYALDKKRYNEKSESMTWETSTLRKWLNGEFYNSAFNSSEQGTILQVINENPDNSRYGTKGGSQTQDRIFLLSIDELNKYFSSIEARKCQVTEYAKEKKALVMYGTSLWWLRSPGHDDLRASSVNIPGRVNLSGNNVDDYRIDVRPAFWLNL